MHRRAVAKDNDLPSIFRRLIPTAIDFAQEQILADKPLDIPRLAANDTALLHSLAGEQVVEPDVGCKGGIQVSHD